MARSFAVLLLAMLMATLFASSVSARLMEGLSRKDLAGPPSEFNQFVLPLPSVGATSERSGSYEVRFTPSSEADGVADWSADLPVDSTDFFAFFLATPVEFTLQVFDPSNKLVNFPAENIVNQGYPIGDSDNDVLATTYILPNPQLGVYHIEVSTPSSEAHTRRLMASAAPNGLLVAYSSSTLLVSSQITDYANLKVNQPVGLSAFVAYEETTADGTVTRRPLLGDSVATAEMEIVFPDGTEEDFAMMDDGLHADGDANDGIYGATVQLPAAGVYTATATFMGKHETDGTVFYRSSTHLLPIATDELDLTGTASISSVSADSDQITISLAADVPQPSDTGFRVYAEVWGTDNGQMVPVAWLANIQEITVASDGSTSLLLRLDPAWLKYANAQEPLELRNVVVQDVTTFVPVSQASSITVAASENGAVARVLATRQVTGPMVITDAMKYGKRPATLDAHIAARRLAGASPQPALLHGYCAGSNPFEDNSQWWPSNAYYFNNPDDNVSNDEFAQLVLSKTSGLGVSSLVGHSQGGLVSLHIVNYYWSTLDGSQNGDSSRVVQSVGSPYLGNSGAGVAADIIAVFGFACGSNTDLSLDGASLWNTGITPDSRDKVWYYTTQYATTGLLHYCNLATNLVLKWPNDGTAEYDLSQLPGGHAAGHVKGECHTDGMKWNPQYDSEDRMKQMADNLA